MRRVSMIALLALSPLLGGGSCSSTPERPTIPQIVEVPVTRFVPLDPALTADCQDEPAKSQQLGEATRLANVRREYLVECSGRMARIRALQPKATP
jgi:hypothetical protein